MGCSDRRRRSRCQKRKGGGGGGGGAPGRLRSSTSSFRCATGRANGPIASTRRCCCTSSYLGRNGTWSPPRCGDRASRSRGSSRESAGDGRTPEPFNLEATTPPPLLLLL